MFSREAFVRGRKPERMRDMEKREREQLREGDERARVADARVGQVLDVATLLVPNPRAFHRLRWLKSTLRRFEGGEGSEEDSDRVTTADGVLGLAEVSCEFVVCLRRALLLLLGLYLLLMVVISRSTAAAAAAAERDRLHSEVVELLNPFPHRTATRFLSEIPARQRRSSREVVRIGRVIVRVPESGPPVTKVGRDHKEGVRVGEVRGEEGAKGLFGRG